MVDMCVYWNTDVTLHDIRPPEHTAQLLERDKLSRVDMVYVKSSVCNVHFVFLL